MSKFIKVQVEDVDFPILVAKSNIICAVVVDEDPTNYIVEVHFARPVCGALRAFMNVNNWEELEFAL